MSPTNVRRAAVMFAFPLMAACAGGPAISPLHPDIVHTHTLTNVIWHEVRNGRIEFVCAKVLGPDRHFSMTGACHFFDGARSHVFTPVVRDFPGLCSFGHELAHHPAALGRFHDRDGNWTLKR